MTGHCRHCEDACSGGLLIPAWPHPEPHMNDDGAEWPEGHCPACAAAERIAKAIDAEAQRTAEAKSDSAWLYGRVDGLDYALAITRAMT